MLTYILHAPPNILYNYKQLWNTDVAPPRFAESVFFRKLNKRIAFSTLEVSSYEVVSEDEERLKKFSKFLKSHMKNRTPNELFGVEAIARTWTIETGESMAKETCGRLLEKLGVIARKKRRAEGMFVGLAFD